MPEHVAIIMDGNGRWANQRGLPRLEGHRRGVNNVRTVVEEAGRLGIRYLTLYAFSVENWRRPQREVDALMHLLTESLDRYAKMLIEQDVSLRSIGRTQELPAKVQDALLAAIEKTRHGRKGTLILALNYGARQELLDAVRQYAETVQHGEAEPADLDWEHFRKHLYTADWPDPDLLIRTSGESRLSNFLLLQCAYSEMIFSPQLWPDFGPDTFREAIASYQRRERRYGLTGEQATAPVVAPVFR